MERAGKEWGRRIAAGHATGKIEAGTTTERGEEERAPASRAATIAASSRRGTVRTGARTSTTGSPSSEGGGSRWMRRRPTPSGRACACAADTLGVTPSGAALICGRECLTHDPVQDREPRRAPARRWASSPLTSGQIHNHRSVVTAVRFEHFPSMPGLIACPRRRSTSSAASIPLRSLRVSSSRCSSSPCSCPLASCASS